MAQRATVFDDLATLAAGELTVTAPLLVAHNRHNTALLTRLARTLNPATVVRPYASRQYCQRAPEVFVTHQTPPENTHRLNALRFHLIDVAVHPAPIKAAHMTDKTFIAHTLRCLLSHQRDKAA